MMSQENRKVLKRGDVVWVELDPAIGTEIKKTRPAIIISNDAQNKAGKRLIVAPLTSNTKKSIPLKQWCALKANQPKQCLTKLERSIFHV